MKCGEVFQSVAAWQRLSGVNMKPRLAFKILKYTKEVGVEYDAIMEQRSALIHEITGTKPGEKAEIQPGSEDAKRYEGGFQEILLVNSDLSKLDIDFSDVIDAVDEKNEMLSVSDLAALEPFFKYPDEPFSKCPDECACDEDLVACPDDGDCCK